MAGYELELTETPHQARVLHQIKCSVEGKSQITLEVLELLSKGGWWRDWRYKPELSVTNLLVEKKDGG